MCLADLVALYVLTDFVPSDSYENGNSKEKPVASNNNQVYKVQCFNVYFDKLMTK